jgi:hypothetical protein
MESKEGPRSPAATRGSRRAGRPDCLTRRTSRLVRLGGVRTVPSASGERTLAQALGPLASIYDEAAAKGPVTLAQGGDAPEGFG